MLECLCVGLGGFIGSVLRYLIGLLAIETASGFPIKTFCHQSRWCLCAGNGE